MVKLVAIDLDGTLLSSDKSISKKNQEAIWRAKQQGVKVVVCTGRPLAAIGSILDELSLRDEDDYSITFNGGLIQKNKSGEVLHATMMNLSAIEEIHQLMVSFDLPVDIIRDHVVYQLGGDSARHSLYSQLNRQLTFVDRKLTDLPADLTVNKIVVTAEPDYLNQCLAKLPSALHERYTIVKSRDCLLEILDPQVDKGKGLAYLTNHLQIDRHATMAIGDEANDLAMIEYAGIGVAMENAVPLVRQAADWITKTNDQDGVSYAIDRVLKQLS